MLIVVFLGVIGSGCEVGVRFVLIFMTACEFIDSIILLFILTAISFVIFFMFLFISSLTFTIIDCRRSFIILETWSF